MSTQTFNPSSVNYERGYIDAREGRAMRSIVFFGHDQDAADYSAGYESGQTVPFPECSICRRRHGLETIHACE